MSETSTVRAVSTEVSMLCMPCSRLQEAIVWLKSELLACKQQKTHKVYRKEILSHIFNLPNFNRTPSELKSFSFTKPRLMMVIKPSWAEPQWSEDPVQAEITELKVTLVMCCSYVFWNYLRKFNGVLWIDRRSKCRPKWLEGVVHRAPNELVLTNVPKIASAPANVMCVLRVHQQKCKITSCVPKLLLGEKGCWYRS